MKDKHIHSHDEERSLMDLLLDEENSEPITLFDNKDKEVKFDQVAIIPLNDMLYAILKPIQEMEGVADDEAIVFAVIETDDGEAILNIETDEAIAMQVFEEYYKLLDEYEANESKK